MRYPVVFSWLNNLIIRVELRTNELPKPLLDIPFLR
jgi:hypothetical protein